MHVYCQGCFNEAMHCSRTSHRSGLPELTKSCLARSLFGRTFVLSQNGWLILASEVLPFHSFHPTPSPTTPTPPISLSELPSPTSPHVHLHPITPLVIHAALALRIHAIPILSYALFRYIDRQSSDEQVIVRARPVVASVPLLLSKVENAPLIRCRRRPC